MPKTLVLSSFTFYVFDFLFFILEPLVDVAGLAAIRSRVADYKRQNYENDRWYNEDYWKYRYERMNRYMNQ